MKIIILYYKDRCYNEPKAVFIYIFGFLVIVELELRFIRVLIALFCW